MPLDPKVHAQIIQAPDKFLKARDIDPATHFINHHGQTRPLVVEHATGRPAFTVSDDGTLAPYEPPAPDPAAPPVVADYTVQTDPAKFGNA